MFSSNTSQVSDATFIEDVFSTFLYTGNGSTQTVTNGINTLTPGALVWIKRRSNTTDHALYDRVRGGGPGLASNLASAAVSDFGIIGFGTTGFTLGSTARVNTNGAAYVSWTFREQPRFFDVVTYTGNGTNRTIAHSLGSVPGCIMVKRLDASADWQVYHRSLANTQYMVLNSTAAAATGATRWNSTTPTATEFSLGTDATVNASGGTYVAYLFAHDAGGFGATGADNVISCGSYVGTLSSPQQIDIGYEPQFILIKKVSDTGLWQMFDVMRGMSYAASPDLTANSSGQEFGNAGPTAIIPIATGFSLTGENFLKDNNATYIYIAIRRGPMRTPTSGTSVFRLKTDAGSFLGATLAMNFGDARPEYVDLGLFAVRSGNAKNFQFADRLRGFQLNAGAVLAADTATTPTLSSSSSSSEATSGNAIYADSNSANTIRWTSASDATGKVAYAFRRAPGFFDVVCYTGTGFVRTVNHNLGVAPELMLIKHRNATNDWQGYAAPLGAGKYLVLNSTAGQAPSVGTDFTRWNATAPTANVFTVSFDNTVNASGGAYIAYLFASCPGVSKVGSYTGTGATQTINCGFSSGARFVLIKRTNATGDWYVWDTARGIVAGNDPYLLLNSTAAEVTNTDWVDTAASGFELSNAAGNLANTNGGSYIFLAIA